MNLQILNISLKNAIMPKEFYWNNLKIDCLNKILKNSDEREFELFAPRMPLNASPLHILLEVKNSSLKVDRELKISKNFLCECTRRDKRKGKGCKHLNVADIKPNALKVKADSVTHMEIIIRYELIGCHEINFYIISSCHTLKLKLIVDTVEFDPRALLLTNSLTPVTIDNFPPPQQALWFFNPYSSDISLRLISHDRKLSFVDDIIIVKQHEHTMARAVFNPRSVGCFDLQIGLIFNDCECKVVIQGECTTAIPRQLQKLENYENPSQFFSCNSPNNDFISQLNPFVIHGDNLCIVLAQNEIFNENLIALQNCSKHCIKFEWQELCVEEEYEIRIEPIHGYLKAGFTKLFRASVKSLGRAMQMGMIPIKCSIFRYDSEIFREYRLPDGYFEYTEKGYYEKPQNWIPNCHHLIHTLYLNVNIAVLNYQMMRKYGIESEEASQQHHMSLLSSVGSSNGNLNNLTCKMSDNGNDNDDRMECMIETLISLIIMDMKREKLPHEMSYLDVIQSSSMNEKKKTIISNMNDVLFECITSISKEHCFIKSTW